MFYETKEEADAAFKRLMDKGIIDWTYYVECDERTGYYYITSWDYNEEW